MIISSFLAWMHKRGGERKGGRGLRSENLSHKNAIKHQKGNT
jgi:hypothetical protein